jgi:UDP-glucose 4-epimerase
MSSTGVGRGAGDEVTMMRRVLLTGASTPLGRRLRHRLENENDVDAVTAIDVHRGVILDGPTDGTATRGRRTALARLIDDAMVDTVVHAGMCPNRAGAATRATPDVISTMQLAAAVSGRRSPVRTVVGISSTEVYPIRSSSPIWRREDEALGPPSGTVAALVLEAEDYMRDVARHQPHVCVAMLRLADLVGPGVASPLTTLLRGRWSPYIAGFDPAVQFLHIDDAVDGVVHAAAGELAGTFNVAGEGAVHWRGVSRLSGRPAVPAPVVPDSVAAALAFIGSPSVPRHLAARLRFGLCVDTGEFTATGFTPRYSSPSCVRAATAGPDAE